MKLHCDRENFIELIRATSEHFGIEEGLVEKDYYVTLFLQRAAEKIPGLVFKGGTSLSKCHKIIDRFSEDLDLTLDPDHFSQGKKRDANKRMIELCDELGFVLSNRESAENHSHANYNLFNVEYPILFPADSIRPELKVELVFFQKSYPDVESKANSYIGSYLEEIGREDIANQYDLISFPIRAQALERTLVDKVFAICDYYLANETTRNSRHIYDVSRILTRVELTDDLKALVESVRECRKPDRTCLSAQDGANVPELLQKIIDTDFFKKDYNDSTEKLLIKPIHYDEAIDALRKVIDSHLFDSDSSRKG